ncbi:MAG: hypothetical protein AAGH89_03420, partial [Verrucomicrobiota bacterium]
RSYPPREKESYSLTPTFNQAFRRNPIRAGNLCAQLVFEFHDLFHRLKFVGDFGFYLVRRRPEEKFTTNRYDCDAANGSFLQAKWP